MRAREALVGREEGRAVLDGAVEAARRGRGSLLLVAGEAGVGKTALVEAALAESDLVPYVGAPSSASSAPYEPIVAVLRAFLRIVPDGFQEPGPLSAHLSVLLPELGRPPASSDRLTLFEAVRRAVERIASHRPASIFLDDLHWADDATIDLLSAAAAWVESLPILLIGAYRSDALPRDHPVRRLRLELRRAGRAHELTVEPLDRGGTARLAARVLGHTPSDALVALVHERAQGMPFFVEELSAALVASGRLRMTVDGLDLDRRDPLPIPEGVRDAVLLRTRELSPAAHAALQIAAVAGRYLRLAPVVDLAGGAVGLDELFERQILVETDPAHGSFRHALFRETIYGDIPWGRRRTLHRAIAERLEARHAPPGPIAEHWSAAQEPIQARRAWIAAVEAACEIHAYRDAARAASRALALWTDDTTPERLELLERLGACAELIGELAEAVSAWRAAADGWHALGELSRAASVERRLATVYEMQGAWEPALASRLAAAEAFAASGLPGEAAAERLVVAAHLRSAASFSESLRLLETVHREADRAGRLDLKARALGHEGNARARLGQYEAGLELMRDGLSLALQHNLVGPAAEVYQRLADGLEHAGQYGQARETYLAASDFCRTNGELTTSQLCLACMTAVLRQIGEWDRTVEVSRSVLAAQDTSAHARTVAAGMLGSVYAFRGDGRRARPLLRQSATLARVIDLAAMEILDQWSCAFVEHLDGKEDAAAAYCRALLDRWERTEERHYAISPLRWATTFFAERGAEAEARACASALSRIAADAASVEALAGLAHALGETILLDGDVESSAEQFERALALLRDAPLPFDLAQTQVRLGIVVATAGQRDRAVEHLTDAYRLARKLGARPLAAQAEHELMSLGAPPERRSRRRNATSPDDGGLSRRELEVLRHVALGQTDREIAQVLVLSPRTVEMHVGNILAKLSCRSRAEAIHRAGQSGVLGG